MFLSSTAMDARKFVFRKNEAVELQKELSAEGNVTGIMTTDYICNPENYAVTSSETHG